MTIRMSTRATPVSLANNPAPYKAALAHTWGRSSAVLSPSSTRMEPSVKSVNSNSQLAETQVTAST